MQNELNIEKEIKTKSDKASKINLTEFKCYTKPKFTTGSIYVDGSKLFFELYKITRNTEKLHAEFIFSPMLSQNQKILSDFSMAYEENKDINKKYEYVLKLKEDISLFFVQYNLAFDMNLIPKNSIKNIFELLKNIDNGISFWKESIYKSLNKSLKSTKATNKGI